MKREGWKNSTFLSSTIFPFLFVQNDDKKKLVNPKFVRDNVSLWYVWRPKKMRLEHNSTNYNYSKKKTWKEKLEH